MSGLVTVALGIAVVLLWQRVNALSLRLDVLAFAERSPEPPTPPREAPADHAGAVRPFEPVGGSAPALAAVPLDRTDAVVEPAAAAVADPALAATPPARAGFEDLFGRRLPIWLGGSTLAVAGLLIVRYSIEAGLLAPAVRVAAALLFGAGLIAGAEGARAGKVGTVDPRIGQALAGAGAASLYGAVLAAADLYHLIGPGPGFAGLAAVTLLAALLSLRFGAPSALLGLVGGLAAPALVAAASPSIPLLAAYLALTVAGLCVLARGRGWPWLGAAALAGGFGWNLLLIVRGGEDAGAALAAGGLALLLATALPALVDGPRGGVARVVALLSGAGQLAALVALGGFAMLDWGLYGLLGLASVWLGRREPGLAALPGAALAIALALLAGWPDPAPARLALVVGGAWGVFGTAALAGLRRPGGRIEDAAHLAALALATGLLPAWHFPGGDGHAVALPALLGAALAGGAAALVLGGRGRGADARCAVLAVTAALLVCVAAALALPGWLVAPATALVALALLGVGQRSSDRRVVAAGALVGGAAALLAVGRWEALVRAVGAGSGADPRMLACWGVPAAVAATFAGRGGRPVDRIAQVLAVLLGYGALAQVLPASVSPLLAAALLAAGGVAGVRAPGTSLAPAIAAAAAVLLAWTVAPLAAWTLAGLGAIGGHPLLSSALPSLADAVRLLAVPALAFAVVGSVAAIGRERRASALVVAATLGFVALHVGYRHLVVIDGAAAFVARGVAERTGWELLLAAGAWAAWRAGARPLAVGLGAASLLHFGWFGLVLHDPLWADQRVGPWLVPAYATALALVAASAAAWPAGGRARAWSAMALIVLFAVTLLRQLCADAVPLAAGTGAGEDIARSVLAVALALGFLRFGIASGRRDWRIGSLALMLAAAAKVFLHDAAGLDGLARIASFAALGFSLIGIGWLYSRYLPEPRTA